VKDWSAKDRLRAGNTGDRAGPEDRVRAAHDARESACQGGGVGYEIFDKSDALGATSFVQNINPPAGAPRGDLAHHRSLDRVQAARSICPAGAPLFSREAPEASA